MTKTKITEITEEYEGETLVRKTTYEKTVEDYKEYDHACGYYSTDNTFFEGTPIIGMGAMSIHKGMETR